MQYHCSKILLPCFHPLLYCYHWAVLRMIWTSLVVEWKLGIAHNTTQRFSYFVLRSWWYLHLLIMCSRAFCCRTFDFCIPTDHIRAAAKTSEHSDMREDIPPGFSRHFRAMNMQDRMHLILCWNKKIIKGTLKWESYLNRAMQAEKEAIWRFEKEHAPYGSDHNAISEKLSISRPLSKITFSFKIFNWQDISGLAGNDASISLSSLRTWVKNSGRLSWRNKISQRLIWDIQ